MMDLKIEQAKKLSLKMSKIMFWGGVFFLILWIAGFVGFFLHQQDAAVFFILNGIVFDQAMTKFRNQHVEKFNQMADDINKLGEELGLDTKVEYQKV